MVLLQMGLWIVVVASGLDIQQIGQQVLVVQLIIGEIDICGIDNQQWSFILIVKKTGIGIVELMEIGGVYGFLCFGAAALNPIQQYLGRRL